MICLPKKGKFEFSWYFIILICQYFMCANHIYFLFPFMNRINMYFHSFFKLLLCNKIFSLVVFKSIVDFVISFPWIDMSHVFSQLHEQQISTNINAAQEGKKPVDAICLPKQEKYKLSRNFIIVICQYVMFAKNLMHISMQFMKGKKRGSCQFKRK